MLSLGMPLPGRDVFWACYPLLTNSKARSPAGFASHSEQPRAASRFRVNYLHSCWTEVGLCRSLSPGWDSTCLCLSPGRDWFGFSLLLSFRPPSPGCAPDDARHLVEMELQMVGGAAKFQELLRILQRSLGIYISSTGL